MKRKMATWALATGVIGIIAGGSVNAGDLSKSIVPTKHNKALTLGTIADIQPGLGTVMIEYGNRFYKTYYAAKAGNWGLAGYQLKEQVEIQETGEATRPGHAEELRAFEHGFLDPLKDAIDAKDWGKFEKAYTAATNGCNGCHVGAGFPYIKYTLPSRIPDIPSMSGK